MTDPIRWLDRKGEASELERSVLESGSSVEPPAGAADHGWERMLGALGPLPPFGSPSGAGTGGASGGGAGLGSAGGAGGVTAATAKAFVVGLMAGGALTGAGALVTSLHGDPVAMEHPRPKSAISAMSAELRGATSVADEGRAQSDDGASVVRAKAAQPVGSVHPSTHSIPTDTAPERTSAIGSLPELGGAEPGGPSALPDAPESASSAPRATEASSLSREAALVREARRRLHAGDLNGAFAELEAARTWFPRGVLLQEREALSIELLDRSGQHAAAEERARAFVRAFPRSPFVPSVRRVIDGPR